MGLEEEPGSGSGWGALGAGDEDEDEDSVVYYFLEESTGYMQPTLQLLALVHTLVAFLCIIGYNCLKVSPAPGVRPRPQHGARPCPLLSGPISLLTLFFTPARRP